MGKVSGKLLEGAEKQNSLKKGGGTRDAVGVS